jgi:hypothetical protein
VEEEASGEQGFRRTWQPISAPERAAVRIDRWAKISLSRTSRGLTVLQYIPRITLNCLPALRRLGSGSPGAHRGRGMVFSLNVRRYFDQRTSAALLGGAGRCR